VAVLGDDELGPQGEDLASTRSDHDRSQGGVKVDSRSLLRRAVGATRPVDLRRVVVAGAVQGDERGVVDSVKLLQAVSVALAPIPALA